MAATRALSTPPDSPSTTFRNPDTNEIVIASVAFSFDPEDDTYPFQGIATLFDESAVEFSVEVLLGPGKVTLRTTILDAEEEWSVDL